MIGIPAVKPYPLWVDAQRRLSLSNRIIDLGCGSNPVKGACVGVDCYVKPVQRLQGAGSSIDASAMQKRGVRFVNSRIDVLLPFKDKEFDFAYTHHVLEHVEDPATACEEMTRIAESGVIITPSWFAEIIFGRPYHKWLVMSRDDTLFFFKKTDYEDRPFGEHPLWDKGKSRWVVDKGTNPFDILLNDGNWYRGREKLPRLERHIRRHWYSHSPLLEVVFLWSGTFK